MSICMRICRARARGKLRACACAWQRLSAPVLTRRDVTESSSWTSSGLNDHRLHDRRGSSPKMSTNWQEKLLRTLAATGKPFVMLLPISCLHVQFVRELLEPKHVQARCAPACTRIRTLGCAR